MKNKYFISIFVLVTFLLLASVFASADSGFFVNDAFSMLPQFFEGVYAIGSDGAELLFSDQVYALTGNGLQLLGSANSVGGGGLLYDDGEIPITSETVKVGLSYSYSAARDSSVSSSSLQSVGGGGFTFGFYDEDGVFEEIGWTDSSRITVRPEADGSVSVTEPENDEPICTLENTGKNLYLHVHPESDDDEPLTICSGNRYYGDFAYAVLANDRLTVVNIVDLDHYVMGVCACEMTESWPLEALKAQAVAARTFAQRMIGSSVYYYTCGFDVTADTYCQAYRGSRGVGETIEEAVYETSNQYLTYNGELIDAVYSAADGGATEDSKNVFGNPNSYLVGVSDPYEAAADHENPYASWKVTMTPAQLGSKLGIDPVASVTPTFSRTGNVIKLECVSVSGQKSTLIRDSCRTTLGMKNIRYEVSKDKAGNFVFTGSGYGHNLGMSQWGAYAMARYYEKDYRFILGFYYTKVGISYGVLR